MAPGVQGVEPRPRLRFKPRQRLLRPADFQLAFKQGFRLSNAHFTVNVRPNGLSVARLGLAVAARAVGNAVARNRVRRLVRETFRLRQLSLPAADFVVAARNEARAAEAAVLRSSFAQLLEQAESRCAG